MWKEPQHMVVIIIIIIVIDENGHLLIPLQSAHGAQV
jgi:hypothetical protein